MFGHYSQIYFENLIKEKRDLAVQGQFKDGFDLKMVIGLIKSYMRGNENYLQSYIDFLNLDEQFLQNYRDCDLILSDSKGYFESLINSKAELALDGLKKYQETINRG